MILMQHFKRILTWALIIFVAAAIVVSFRPRETVVIPDGISLLFWRAEKRCARCLTMEELIHQALSDYENVRLFELEYDVFANQSLAQQFNVGSITVILVERKDQKNVRVRDLTDEVRRNHDDTAFVNMLQKELATFVLPPQQTCCI